MTGGSNKRVSLAALIVVKPGCRPRLIYRVHAGGFRNDRRKGFTETDYARLLDDAHQQLGGPLVVVWDNLTTHVSRAMNQLIAARDWLTVRQLPPYAPELKPVETAGRGRIPDPAWRARSPWPRRTGVLSSNLQGLPAINRQGHAGYEAGVVRSQEYRGVCDIPGASHPAAQRYLRIPVRYYLLPAEAITPDPGLDCHRRVYQARKYRISTNSPSSISDGDVLHQGDDTRLSSLIPDAGIVHYRRYR